MNIRDQLLEKIKNKTVKVGVIGMGYVGLPLAVEFATEKCKVFGIDLDEAKIRKINAGESYIQDVKSTMLKKIVDDGYLQGTDDFSVLSEIDVVSICVPTPLRKSKDPDMSYILKASRQISNYLHKGILIILESTTYPGTTEEVILPLLEKSGLKVGEDFFLAFSPERVDPGNLIYQTKNIPKIVGGVTPACTELAAAFYSISLETVHQVSSPRSAEMVKLLENTFRSVNIGLVNEMCQMSQKLNVDIWEIIDAASTKPFGFMPFYPGPGLGGHCIPIDPHYLAWKARSSGFTPKFIELADQVNSTMPEFVVQCAQNLLNGVEKPLKNSKIHLIGVTYKKNVADVRESPAAFIVRLLRSYGAIVSYSDPYVSSFTVDSEKLENISLDESAGKSDLAILITNHDVFDYERILTQFGLILDTRNAFKGSKAKHVHRL